ncbi:MAG: adenylosuccinate lyase [Planctomycetes bacterium]|nr:adenylosuccinate lyase [Planctomycetota bacterium]
MERVTNVYTSPFAERYSTPEMLRLFSADHKFRTWRRLWVALAEAERALGLPITAAQIREMKAHVEDVNTDVARRYEERLKHDVMAHVRAYGDQCPKATGVIHLGATSMYVVDNTDLVVLRDALQLVRRELVNVIAALTAFAKRYADTPTVAYTHFQPAQFTTIGKRACLWIQDLMLDLEEVERRLGSLRFLGAKGATGTQASFLELFEGDHAKVKDLDRRVARAMGFSETYPVTGQTYSRKVDAQAAATLGGIAQSAHKFANDLRLLQHHGEIQEPFEEEQVGSSAMAYKRNPMKAERMTSLARLVIALGQNAAFTAAGQWFERTLDDSAGKRVANPEMFLGADAILTLWMEIASRPVVNRDIVRANVERQLPFVATENVLMAAVKAGGDRQVLHERIRRHALAAVEAMHDGKGNDLIARLKNDEAFRAIRQKLDHLGRPERYVGRAPEQAREFIAQEVEPVLRSRRKLLGWKAVVKV